jgi:protocatechuate 3,4-dioxygenase beta subunit
MRKVLVAVGAAAVVAVIAYMLLRKGETPTSDTPATPGVTQGSNVQVSPEAKPQTPAQLAVIVTDAKGPLAGARVRIAPTDGDVTVLETKADGTASTTLEPGSYTIAASAKDHQPGAAPKITLDPGETEKVTIKLEDGGRTLSGLVTDVSGGPIAGARVDAAKLATMARPDSAVATAMTGADGKYAMTVAEGQLLVAARSPDYAAQSRYVDVGAGGATADFSLVPGGVIEGVVIDDRSKQPVAGAHVVARRDSASILLAEGGAREVTTTADGRFRITGLRPGAYELGAKAEGRRTRTPTLVGLGVAEQVTDVQLLVGKTPIVRGTVVDDAGAPVVGARVVTFANFGADSVKSDDKGAFVLDGLAAGPHMLMGRAETHIAASPTRIEIADKDVDGVVLRMIKAGKLKGHVEPRQASCEVSIEPDDDGPRGHGRMMMMGGGASTAPDGSFELAPVTPGKLQLAARCASGDQGKVTVDWTAAIADVALAVSPGGSIAGKVLDGDGKPVAGITVMANGTQGTMRTTIVNGAVTSGIQGVTAANGTYELKGLAPNKYRVTALDRGRPVRSRKDAPLVTLAATEKKTGVDLAIDRANGVIKGIVTGPDGKPLADAWVSVHQDLEAMLEGALGDRPGRPGPGPGPGGPDGPGPGPDGPDGEEGGESRMVMVQASDDDAGGGGGSYPPALTDAQGRFEITGLPHLPFDVVAEAQAGKLRGRANAVKPDATLTIQALGVTSLSGTVRGASGPAGLFTVVLEGPTRTQRSFTDGTFSLGRVDAGNYVVRVTSSEGNGEARVVVAANTPATVDIALVANAVIVGTVVDPEGKPVAGVDVIAVDDQPEGMMALSLDGPPPATGPDGKFRIERKAGKAMVVVMTPPRPVAKRGLVLEAGKTTDLGNVQIAAPPK